jgi:predicted SprT family Zn-dependent metalloprotease
VLRDSVALSENHLECSKGIVVDCRCGEKLILLDRKSDWYKEGHTDFECGGCEAKLSLEDGR